MELLPGEEIRPIQGFDHYSITSFGRVWSDYQGGHWLKPTINSRVLDHVYQREYVSLERGNKRYVHKLVAEAFIPNPDNLPEVDHKDTNPLNNHVENLRWATHSENMKNERTMKEVSKNSGAFKEVLDTKTGKIYKGYQETANACGVCKNTVRKHVNQLVKNPRWVLTGNRISGKTGKILEKET